MKDEMKSLFYNKKWELSMLPMGKKALHNKLVYEVNKGGAYDSFKRYKV